MPEIAVDALREHKVRQLEERLRAGAAWKDAGLIFTTVIGTAIDGKNLLKTFQAHLRTADLPVIPFHALRHSAATIMLAMGVQPKIVAEMLGHTSTRITEDVYTHVLPHLQEEAAEKMNRFFGGG